MNKNNLSPEIVVELVDFLYEKYDSDRYCGGLPSKVLELQCVLIDWFLKHNVSICNTEEPTEEEPTKEDTSVYDISALSIKEEKEDWELCERCHVGYAKFDSIYCEECFKILNPF